MSEAPSSSDLLGTSAVSKRIQLAVESEQLAGQICGKVAAEMQSPLEALSRGIELLRQIQIPQRIIDLFARNIRCLVELAGEIKNNPLTKHTTEEFHAVLLELVQQFQASFPNLTIVLEPLPDDVRARAVLASSSLWKGILEKLLNNAAAPQRKADRVVITLSSSVLNGEKFPAIRVSVTDNGNGMKPAILKAVQKGERVIETPLHEKAEERGLGLITVGFLIERSNGVMHVDSVHVDDDPVNHGTTLSFTLPDLTALKEIPKEHTLPSEAKLIETPPACTEAAKDVIHPQEQPMPTSSEAVIDAGTTHTRRRWLKVMGAGAVASIMAAFTVPEVLKKMTDDTAQGPARPEDSPEQPRPVISDLVFDAQGRIVSCMVATPKGPIMYRLGEKNPLFREYSLPEGSVLSFDVMNRGVPDHLQFLCSVPSGVFGALQAAEGRGYMSMTNVRKDAPLAIGTDQVFVHGDAAFARGLRATSARYLQRPELPVLRPELQRLAIAARKKQERDGGPSLDRVGNTLQALLTVHERFHGRAVTVETRDEFRKQLEVPDTFILLGEELSAALRVDRPTAQEKALMKRRNYDLCMRNMTTREAETLLLS
jgi:hypothetical protein